MLDVKEIWRKKVDNYALAWSEFESKTLTPTSMPFKGIVELTQNCNFRCIMCPQSWDPKFAKYKAEYNMPMDTFVKIAEQFFPYANFIDLRGFGETTILPWWPELVDYLENHPFIEWHLVTNLGLPRPQTWDKMIRTGFVLGFSCDGATKDVFESIRQRSNFDTICENLKTIQDAIKKNQTGFLYFISTIQRKNIHELRALVEMAARYQVGEVQFKMVQPKDADQDPKKMNPDEIRLHCESAIDAALDLGVRVLFNDWTFTKGIDPKRVQAAANIDNRRSPRPFPAKPSFDPDYWEQKGMPRIFDQSIDSYRVSVNQRCFKPFSYVYINYEAKMGTCNHMMFPDMLEMGDLKKQSMREIWNSPAYQKFRSDLLLATPTDHRCQWCFKHRMDD
ncbi:MAG: SPASM domain-containing protein [Bdellovibrionales bacterium]|nr:SPASM domain-containing protein [Bdellovibrionales bacterium]